MSDLDTYLELTEREARRQWLSIAERTRLPRQVPFVPVETILAFGLFFILRPNRYGGANIHQAPRPVHQLGDTCRRTAASFTNKMLNLEGARPNGKPEEPALFLALADDHDRFIQLYVTAIRGARLAGLLEDAVPDFLSLHDHRSPVLPPLPFDRAEFAPDEADIIRVHQGYRVTQGVATRLLGARQDLEERRYAREVLAAWDHRCGLCGMGPRNIDPGILLSSVRLKPRPNATAKEAVDPRNGVGTCATHGLALRRGLLSVDPGGRILVATALHEDIHVEPGMARAFGPGVVLPQVLGPLPASEYSQWHGANVYRG